MNIRIHRLHILTKLKVEEVSFDADVSFIHGAISQGKSTAARLVDYCLGGSVERTPALRSEFIAAALFATLGPFEVKFERSAHEYSPVRVTWSGSSEEGSVNAPLAAGESPIIEPDVYNLSDLIFYFCGIKPIKVRRSKQDFSSAVVRLSFRDLMWYCFLHQNELDSSFFELGTPQKNYKSRDVMRFVTGLFSERLSDCEIELSTLTQDQRVKREAVDQVRNFMAQFQLASTEEFQQRRSAIKLELATATARLEKLDSEHKAATHPADPIRAELRKLSEQYESIQTALAALGNRIEQQEALRSELITAKLKSARIQHASVVLGDISFENCPQCGTDLDVKRLLDPHQCRLCAQIPHTSVAPQAADGDIWNRDIDARIDELKDSLTRHRREQSTLHRRQGALSIRRTEVDSELSREMARYDSATRRRSARPWHR